MNLYESGSVHQNWIIVGVRIQNRHDVHLVLAVEDWNEKNGAAVCALKFTGGDNQRWNFDFV